MAVRENRAPSAVGLVRPGMPVVIRTRPVLVEEEGAFVGRESVWRRKGQGMMR